MSTVVGDFSLEYLCSLVSPEWDELAREQYETHTRWVVELKNGGRMVGVDNHPKRPQFPSSWLALREYVGRTGDRIVRLGIAFRDNVYLNVLPENAQSYFFSKGLMADPGGFQSGFYVLGAQPVGEPRVFIRKFTVPELMLLHDDWRSPEECQHALIVNRTAL